MAVPPSAAGAARQIEVDEADVELAARLGSLELSYVTAYQALTARGGLAPAEAQVLAALAAHHLNHASAFQTLLRVLDRGAAALGSDPELDAELAPLVAAGFGRAAVLAAALAIEEIAAASATLAVERARGTRAVQLAAEVAPVEAQHVLLLGTLLDRPVGERLADFETTGAQRLDGGDP